MSKGTEERLARLRELAQGEPSALLQELRKALGGANGVVAGRAAAIVAERGLTELGADLERAFLRFVERPKQDPGCVAKLAVVQALETLDRDADELHLAGLHHVQMEPVWGGQVDTAANLRGTCALALVKVNYPDILFELVTLAMDPEVEARRAAVRALGYAGGHEAELLLRMKALAGDKEPDVLAECFSALVRVAPDRSIAFVDGFVASPDPVVAEGAALALGESRQEEALERLRRHWQGTFDRGFKQMLLLPIALLRTDGALAFLLETIDAADAATATAAAEAALRIYGMDADRGEHITAAAGRRGLRVVLRSE